MCVESHVHFVLLEVLKNAFQTSVNRMREEKSLSEIPPVLITAQKKVSNISIPKKKKKEAEKNSRLKLSCF